MAGNKMAKEREASRTNQGGESSQTSQLMMSEEERYQRVARAAYELYQQRGEVHGYDLDDWLTAERLVDEEGPRSSLSTPAVVEEP